MLTLRVPEHPKRSKTSQRLRPGRIQFGYLGTQYTHSDSLSTRSCLSQPGNRNPSTVLSYRARGDLGRNFPELHALTKKPSVAAPRIIAMTRRPPRPIHTARQYGLMEVDCFGRKCAGNDEIPLATYRIKPLALPTIKYRPRTESNGV